MSIALSGGRSLNWLSSKRAMVLLPCESGCNEQLSAERTRNSCEVGGGAPAAPIAFLLLQQVGL